MFKHFTLKQQISKLRRKSEKMEIRQNVTELSSTIAFVTLAERGDIDEVTATEHTNLFSSWTSGMQYTVGALRQYKDELYRCVQAHTSQDDWTPDVAVSLWTKVGDPNEEFPQWSQPIGAHDSYSTGDKVTYNNEKWVSICDSNIWSPGVYGWRLEK